MSALMQRGPYPLRRKGHLAQAYACGIEDRIGDGGRARNSKNRPSRVRAGRFVFERERPGL